MGVNIYKLFSYFLLKQPKFYILRLTSFSFESVKEKVEAKVLK